MMQICMYEAPQPQVRSPSCRVYSTLAIKRLTQEPFNPLSAEKSKVQSDFKPAQTPPSGSAVFYNCIFAFGHSL